MIYFHPLCICIAVLMFAGAAASQTHYAIPFPVPTSSNMTIAIPQTVTPTINGVPIQNGDEIAVFDSIGQCCGFTTWKANTGNSITAWGDKPITAEQDGFKEHEKLRFRVWDSSARCEVLARARDTIFSNITADSLYVSQGIAMIASLTASYADAKVPPAATGIGPMISQQGDALICMLPHSMPVKISLFGLDGKGILLERRTGHAGVNRIPLRDRNLRRGRYAARVIMGATSHALPVIIGR